MLVHDVVNGFIDPHDAALAAALVNVRQLLAAARTAGVPLVFAAPGQGDPAIGPPPDAPEDDPIAWGTPGADVPSSVEVRPDDLILRKPRFGAFFGTALAGHMRALGRDTLVICGISLAGGVETTVRDAYNHDLRSVVVADACLARPIPDVGWGAVPAEQVRTVTLSIFAQRYARVLSTAETCSLLTA